MMPMQFNLKYGCGEAWVCAAALALAACASDTMPPTDLMAVSSAAVADAGMAGASEFAPLEMRMAREKMDRAQVAMTTHAYEQARTLALEAQVDAQLAIAKTHSIKAGKASAAVNDDSRALREELQRQSK